MKRFVLPFVLCGGILATACSSDDTDKNLPSDTKSIAEQQLKADYADYNITDIKWRNSNGYDVALFSANTKAAPQQIEAWYQVENGKAGRVLDNRDFGTVIPEAIREAFEHTIYADASLWKVDDVDLETRFNGHAMEVVYVVEMESILHKDLEAKLLFNAKGELIFSKEYEDDKDDEEKFIVDQRLLDAVHAIFPDAEVVDAEFEDGIIEVDALRFINDRTIEIEFEFDRNYKLLSYESEQEYLFGELPMDFKTPLTHWYGQHESFNYPMPTDLTKVEVEEKKGKFEGVEYSYKLEFEVLNTEFTFYFDVHYAIVGEEIDLED